MGKTLLENCLKIIAIWEGNTLYAHGNGAVGIIGFQFGLREDLCRLMGIPSDSNDDQFNAKVREDEGKARQCQMQLGVQHLNGIYEFSCKPRQLSSFTANLIVLDIGINNGEYNNFLGPKLIVNNEQNWAVEVCETRINAIKHMFDRWPGLKVRYDWYLHRAQNWDIEVHWPEVRIAPKNKTVKMD